MQVDDGLEDDEHLDGLIVSDIGANITHRQLIVSLAEVARLPTVYPYRTYFDLGGLMVYGSDLAALQRWVANDIDQIWRLRLLDGASREEAAKIGGMDRRTAAARAA